MDRKGRETCKILMNMFPPWAEEALGYLPSTSSLSFLKVTAQGMNISPLKFQSASQGTEAPSEKEAKQLVETLVAETAGEL